MLVEASELGERFPDLPDSEVFDFMEDMFRRRFNPDSVLGRAVIIAYSGRLSDARRYFASATYPIGRTPLNF